MITFNEPERKEYPSVKLINEVNLINSVQSFSDFIDESISGAERRNCRRPKSGTDDSFHYSMRFEDFDILINKGFMNNVKEFDQYIRYGNIRAYMQRH